MFAECPVHTHTHTHNWSGIPLILAVTTKHDPNTTTHLTTLTDTAVYNVQTPFYTLALSFPGRMRHFEH